MYQDFSTHHDWPVAEAIVDLPIKIKGNSICTSGDPLSLLEAQNKDIGTASQTLLTKVKIITSATQSNQGLKKSKLVHCSLGQVGLLAQWARVQESHPLTKSRQARSGPRQLKWRA